MYQNVVTQNN